MGWEGRGAAYEDTEHTEEGLHEHVLLPIFVLLAGTHVYGRLSKAQSGSPGRFELSEGMLK